MRRVSLHFVAVARWVGGAGYSGCVASNILCRSVHSRDLQTVQCASASALGTVRRIRDTVHSREPHRTPISAAVSGWFLGHSGGWEACTNRRRRWKTPGSTWCDLVSPGRVICCRREPGGAAGPVIIFTRSVFFPRSHEPGLFGPVCRPTSPSCPTPRTRQMTTPCVHFLLPNHHPLPFPTLH